MFNENWLVMHLKFDSHACTCVRMSSWPTMCSRVLTSWGDMVIFSRGVVTLDRWCSYCGIALVGVGMWKRRGPTFTTFGGGVTLSFGVCVTSRWVWSTLLPWWYGGLWTWAGVSLGLGCRLSSMLSKLVFQTNTCSGLGILTTGLLQSLSLLVHLHQLKRNVLQ